MCVICVYGKFFYVDLYSCIFNRVESLINSIDIAVWDLILSEQNEIAATIVCKNGNKLIDSESNLNENSNKLIFDSQFSSSIDRPGEFHKHTFDQRNTDARTKFWIYW